MSIEAVLPLIAGMTTEVSASWVSGLILGTGGVGVADVPPPHAATSMVTDTRASERSAAFIPASQLLLQSADLVGLMLIPNFATCPSRDRVGFCPLREWLELHECQASRGSEPTFASGHSLWRLRGAAG